MSTQELGTSGDKSVRQSLKETHIEGKTIQQRKMLLKRQVLFHSPPCKPCCVLFAQDCNIRVSLYVGCSYKHACMHHPHLKPNPWAKIAWTSNPSSNKVKTIEEKKRNQNTMLWNFSHGSTQRHANSPVNNWLNLFPKVLQYAVL